MQNFFSKKCLLEYKNQFAVEKNTKKIYTCYTRKKLVFECLFEYEKVCSSTEKPFCG